MNRFRFGAVVSGLAIIALISPSSARVTQTDLLVAGRALGFINNLKRGDVRVGIVYDPGRAQSAQQANEFAAAMAGGFRVGSAVLHPVTLSIGEMAGANVDVLLLTAGLGAEAAEAGRVSRARKLPCLTFDLAQVRNAVCAMGVRSNPKIEVIVNRAAAKASGLDLAAAFRLLITEI